MTFGRLVSVERPQSLVVFGLDLPLALMCHGSLPLSACALRSRFQYRQRERSEDDLTEPLLGAIALPEIDHLARLDYCNNDTQLAHAWRLMRSWAARNADAADAVPGAVPARKPAPLCVLRQRCGGHLRW
jgi:hypothetical protein